MNGLGTGLLHIVTKSSLEPKLFTTEQYNCLIIAWDSNRYLGNC